MTKKPLPPQGEQRLDAVRDAMQQPRGLQHLLLTAAGFLPDEVDTLLLLGDVRSGAEQAYARAPLSDEAWRAAQYDLAVRSLDATAESFCYRHAVDPLAELWR